MNSNDIFGEARVRHVRELKAALAETRERLLKAESERDLILAHFPLALTALRDFECLEEGAQLRVIDGWNAVLRLRNVSKLSQEEVSALKRKYLAEFGISGEEEAGSAPVDTWIVFDGKIPDSFRSGRCRVTYTGGTGPHRADRMIADYVNAAAVLGLDVSRITVETSDRDLASRVSAAGAMVAESR